MSNMNQDQNVIIIPELDNKSMVNQIQLSEMNVQQKKQQNQKLENLKYSFYLFVNPTSGELNLTRVIVGGGDGTVLWVIDEMINHQIDFQNCPIGVIPFGTGNDFSRQLGWGGACPSPLIGKGLCGLKRLIWRWIHSSIEDFDIWNISIRTQPDGGFVKISKVNGKSVKECLKDPNGQNVTHLKKKMSNYCSFGVESRIGFGFDKNRTSSRCGNLVVYCLEGIKKMFLRHLRINKLVEGLYKVDENSAIDESNEEQQQKSNVEIVMQNVDQQYQMAYFSTNKNIQQPQLIGNPVSLVMLNINSFAAGTNPWGASIKNKIGINMNQNKLSEFTPQNFGDGKLEFCSFYSTIGLALERLKGGQSKRISQTTGKVQLLFKAPALDIKEQNKQNSNMPKIISYFQIDGEYYQIINPKSMTVQPTKDINPNGKIKVLLANNQKTIFQ